jgi:uncharacterized protein (TIGR00369 family)
MNKQANSQDCFVCGINNPFGLQMKFYDAGPGEVRAEYTVSSHFQGYPGVVHGGVVAAMLDEVTSRTYMQGDPPKFYVTASLNIRYRKPVPVEKPLKLCGHAIRERGKVVFTKGEIFDSDGTLLAEADAVFVAIPPDLMGNSNASDSGWQVYPDE